MWVFSSVVHNHFSNTWSLTVTCFLFHANWEINVIIATAIICPHILPCVQLCNTVFFQESDSPVSSNAAIQLHPLTLASVHSVMQMATDLRATHPAGFLHTMPQVGFIFMFPPPPSKSMNLPLHFLFYFCNSNSVKPIALEQCLFDVSLNVDVETIAQKTSNTLLLVDLSLHVVLFRSRCPSQKTLPCPRSLIASSTMKVQLQSALCIGTCPKLPTSPSTLTPQALFPAPFTSSTTLRWEGTMATRTPCGPVPKAHSSRTKLA